ncbi:MAG: HAMP domain-containing histidine kinase [Gemmatimonadetes bacterium]|nr:HAMP domain-containing histidine kinase [Gemmatimonadota bacterium]MCC6772972.1 HAMP domain-containing histidine kinase [Gemmatimonadaceae bacterium]
MFSRWRERIRHALGFRLALWYAVIFVASSLTLVALTYTLLAGSLRQYDRETVEGTLVKFAGAFGRGGVDGLVREMRTTQIASSPGPFFVRTVGSRQDLIFLSMPDALRRFDLSQLAAPSLNGEQTWATVETGEGGGRLEVASVLLPDGTLFQVGMSTERRDELLRRFRRALLLVFASIVLIGLAGGLMLTWSALQPVRTLADTAQAIMRTGRTDTRVPVMDSRDALGALSAQVNAMLERIDAVVAGMRGALDNVAHDLRTPMARLRGTAETALASNDAAVWREALGESLEESDQVIAMLNTLLDVSEAETGTLALNREPVELADLAQRTLELYEDVAEQRGVHLDISGVPSLVVPLDRNRMRQVLANLVDNAIKHTPAGGRVAMAAAREVDHVVLTVTDTGAGIPADELPHIWTRLYRGDSSRSARGLGLGLSLVKAIVEAHGGEVSVSSSPGAGARFTLHLPTSPPDLSAM